MLLDLFPAQRSGCVRRLSMLMSTVVAVAIGMAPVPDDAMYVVSGDYSARVGRFAETVDRRGNRHLKGFSPTTGAPYDLIVHRDGRVEGTVGDLVVSFRVREAG
jgi:hypothetical protein